MALIKAGVWHTTVWASGLWQEDLWLEYGAVAPPPPTPPVGGYLPKVRVSDDLAMLSLVLIARRRRKRRLKNYGFN